MIGTARTGSASNLGLSLKMAGIPVLFMLFFVGLTTFGQRLARDDERYLRAWLAERLRSASRQEPTVG